MYQPFTVFTIENHNKAVYKPKEDNKVESKVASRLFMKIATNVL